MNWLSSMLSDGENGSVSSKRVITFLAFLLCGASFMIDQIMGLKADSRLFDAMMYIVVAGLGFTASEKFASKK